ncbi:2-octaprenyl-6-methoxyphenyl hydroxylase [Pseudidiomarina sp. 1APR75-15]|uniref:2-octaprenyl-6-methoxyphenyl hydroxylase n=1 Tax=Pseudidiomarina terrestris TaxID=2820060 RepID=A0ABT8MIT9_9GAMM|nr:MULTISPECIES: 2-octaprenyl-6-methoxyphenyl hydroxylase [unclassified Pseudidiomarina]MDN7129864.1 2-octaprenyl-6-methoxyphenyl hydroxylase [Pseudidiomarina sp. 1APR75-15]MEA3589031.1 2-octaprenyl-6-methoxyphenyl hydroxylase [Pseudidiomarina sp. 1APP75-27a]
MDADKLTSIIIAGGGLVGSLTALLLARRRSDLSICIVEPNADGPVDDKRTIALAAATVELLQQHGIWPDLAAESEAIKHIHVSDRGYLGATRLHAEDEGVTALGQVVPAAALNRALYQHLADLPNVLWRGGTQVTAVAQHSDSAQVTVAPVVDAAGKGEGEGEGEQLRCQLLIGADGQRSFVRQALGITMQVTDYQQVGIIATVELAESLKGWAYERFTETGPVALLPLPNRQASLVWSVAADEADKTLALSDADFLRDLQEVFGYRAGRLVGIGERLQFPLQLHLAERSVAHRAVIIGNASHTLHPIAGQGFNLGVRDAISLSDQLARASDPGAYATLADYWQQRKEDYRQIIGLTDLLVRGFSNHHWPMNKLRNLALLGLDALPLVRNSFARQTMGLSHLAKGERR